MKKIDAFRSFDGRLFETAAQARAYEKSQAPALVVGLTAEQIQAAINRTDPDLADALEQVGKLCEAKRVESGDLKRRRKRDAENANGQGASSSDEGRETPSPQEPEEASAAPHSSGSTDDIPAFMRRNLEATSS